MTINTDKKISLKDNVGIYEQDVDHFHKVIDNVIDDRDDPNSSHPYVWDALRQRVDYTARKATIQLDYGMMDIDYNVELLIRGILNRGMDQLDLITRGYLIHDILHDGDPREGRGSVDISSLDSPLYYYSNSYFEQVPIRHHDLLQLSDYVISRLSIISYGLDLVRHVDTVNFPGKISNIVWEQDLQQVLLDMQTVHRVAPSLLRASIIEARKEWGGNNFILKEDVIASLTQQLHDIQSQEGKGHGAGIAKKIRQIKGQDDVLYDRGRWDMMGADPIYTNDWSHLLTEMFRLILHLV